MILDLKKHGASLIRWLEDPASEIFLAWVRELREVSNSSMLKGTGIETIFRAQGEVRAFNRILDLKKDCQEALKGSH